MRGFSHTITVYPKGGRIKWLSASLLNLYPANMKVAFFDVVRLFFRLFHGYSVYYIEYNNEVIAYSFFKKNYLHKYSFMRDRDVIINPYYVSPDYRGHGLGAELLKFALSNNCENWGNVFAIVMGNNIASIKTLNKLGFSLIGYAEKNRFSYRLSETTTDRLVYRIKAKKGNTA